MKEESKAMEKTKKTKKKLSKIYMILIAIVLIIIIVDQVSKICIANVGEVSVIPEFLKFKVSENNSGAYGIGSDSVVMYVLTNLVILAIIFKFITTQNDFIDTRHKVLLSFIFAGGLSNVIDKVFRGYVLEFIDFTDFIKLPIFNIADIFILIGWLSVAAIFASFTVKEWRSNKKKEKKD